MVKIKIRKLDKLETTHVAARSLTGCTRRW